MELQDSVLKEFADAVNNNSLVQTSDSQHLYATVSRNIEGTGDLVYVRLNGSEIDTPARSLVKVGVGDVVMCAMRGHTLTIIGNVSYPALTRIENVYMTLTAEGLLIGMLDANNQPSGSYIIIGPSGSSIYNGDGVLVASYGGTVQVGKSSQSHVVITDAGVEIQNGQNKVLANFTSNGIRLNDSTGVTIAEFGTSTIAIGKSTSATITFCGGKAVISLDGTTLKVAGGNGVGAIGLSNTYNNRYRSEVVCEAKNTSPRAAVQLLDNRDTITSIILSKDGVNVTVPTGKALTENGVEVAKVNDVFAYGTVTWTTSDAVTQGVASHRTYEATINVPTGYYLAGISRIYVNNTDWGVREFDANWNTKKVVVKLAATTTNNGVAHIPKSVAARWFAIRTSGVKSGGDTNIELDS